MTNQRFTLTRSEMSEIDFTQEACDVLDAVIDTLSMKYAPMGYGEALDFNDLLFEAAERITLANLA